MSPERFRKINFLVFHRMQKDDFNGSITSPAEYEYWLDRLYNQYDRKNVSSIDYEVKMIMEKYKNE